MAEKWFQVGKIVNTHGIRGEVRVVSVTDFPDERYKRGNRLYIFQKDKEPVEVIVKSHRIHKNFDLLSFEGYDSINEVEPFKGSDIKVPESQLGSLDEGEYYFHEIIGCSVYTEDGDELGIINEILTPGANDVWVVKRKGKKDLLIPYIEDVVKHIDVKEKRVIIFPMEGLLDK
ncbi:MAG: ribosome maturation factor RimM [Bacillaceae bacterium]|jgi:16S rRNA processing protein RimM|uniref:Ribosome maturation factor RimM n=2 Tax=Aeribacillus TaxID=1055323 RepID=A0A164BZW4_9BACI|nr:MULTISPECIES: ribosome maturation factor RimM [Aeribacillus]AXI39864.1 ribosome maturation factor RimM [Bacillaceae bacterium ZC4]REJ16718.1 MAG: ribosome maturation factor RimM [Bacillaceae bacterium]ASS91580.1 ribosome maturation factor RimM [Aeribacillus pallidus]KZM57999.1 ribosome maturation factor RimM [Aeribacillus pallidus]MDR9791864.1 ribosome maturation factor RimM [Aeribacillus pallidus]